MKLELQNSPHRFKRKYIYEKSIYLSYKIYIYNFVIRNRAHRNTLGQSIKYILTLQFSGECLEQLPYFTTLSDCINDNHYNC